MESLQTLDPMERLVVMQGVPLFSELATEDLERIAKVTVERRYEPGEVVFSLGESGDEMLVIVEGGCEVSRRAGGDRQHIVSLGSGDFVGELAVLRREPRVADVHAGEDGLLGLVIDAATLESILQERPRIALSMLATLAEKLAVESVELPSG